MLLENVAGVCLEIFLLTGFKIYLFKNVFFINVFMPEDNKIALSKHICKIQIFQEISQNFLVENKSNERKFDFLLNISNHRNI